ncbi:hypothetical protein [Croceicoccus naphthovorans]|uniref:hypothetical protein n=1 Tax=Croceicoccus naphthovorans TaxID=1348774 RepID=UPI000B09E191|nr:hypothetical protein [Croceicoccus naphthovorans]MBB3991320.1 hypothetical protein [Croceicoccus naphthovorans]
MKTYNARRWLRKVGKASVRGMSDAEIAERGLEIMLSAMRSAYAARHPSSQMADKLASSSRTEGGADRQPVGHD